MDADQLDLKITGHVVTPGRVLEDGWIGVRGEIVAAGGVTMIIEMPYDAEAPVVAGDVLDRKKDRLHRQAVLDVALPGKINPPLRPAEEARGLSEAAAVIRLDEELAP